MIYMPHGLCLSKISTCAVMFVTTNGIVADLASRIDQKLFLSLCTMGLIIQIFITVHCRFKKKYSTLVLFLGLLKGFVVVGFVFRFALF